MAILYAKMAILYIRTVVIYYYYTFQIIWYFALIFFLTLKYAGIRNAHANTHASGDAKQANMKPNFGTINTPIKPLANISITPEVTAKTEYPIP